MIRRYLLPPVEAAVAWPLPPFESAASPRLISPRARPLPEPRERREAEEKPAGREERRGEEEGEGGRKKGEGKKKGREEGKQKESSDLRFVSGKFFDTF